MLSEREKFIAIIDNDYELNSDAIILLEGDGFSRYPQALDLYLKGMAPKIVFSGNITNYEYGSYPFKDIKDKLFDAGVAAKDLIHEDKSMHTQEQAKEVIQLAIKKGWKKLLLVASYDHHYRAYLTFLKVILNSNSDILLFNSPPKNLYWFQDTAWGNRFERLDQEFERIKKYSKFGHLATYKQAIDYQKWKEQQILRK